MKLVRTCVFVVPVVTLLAADAGSHHSLTPVYDVSKQITLAGVVTEFRFVNPHAMMLMDVTDNRGRVVQWTVEFSGELSLTGAGWTADSIKRRERVTVTGNPTHTGSPRIAFTRLVRSDGTELLGPLEGRVKSIEEERRQRALRRNQQK